MTALTPQQMRELADEAHLGMVGMIVQIEGEWGHGTSIEELRERGDEDVLLADKVAAALRTAADQLEAVGVLLPTIDPGSPYMYDPWTDESVDPTNIEDVVRAAASAGWNKGSYELARRIREVLESEPSDD